jgi:hypothetical protein
MELDWWISQKHHPGMALETRDYMFEYESTESALAIENF